MFQELGEPPEHTVAICNTNSDLWMARRLAHVGPVDRRTRTLEQIGVAPVSVTVVVRNDRFMTGDRIFAVSHADPLVSSVWTQPSGKRDASPRTRVARILSGGRKVHVSVP